jgi:hypothetical protein
MFIFYDAVLKVCEFVTTTNFHPSLIFAGKCGANIDGDPEDGPYNILHWGSPKELDLGRSALQ